MSVETDGARQEFSIALARLRNFLFRTAFDAMELRRAVEQAGTRLNDVLAAERLCTGQAITPPETVDAVMYDEFLRGVGMTRQLDALAAVLDEVRGVARAGG